MWEWTPPSDNNPIKCKAALFFLALFIAAKRASFVKNPPSWISLVILVNSWYIILPAPIFKCPTSEFPICPSGNPTDIPLACNSLCGYLATNLSKFSFFAASTAFPSPFGAIPNPSNIINITGFLAIIPSKYRKSFFYTITQIIVKFIN